MDPGVVMGIDSKLFQLGSVEHKDANLPHHDEVETVTVYKGGKMEHIHRDGCNDDHCGHNHDEDTERAVVHVPHDGMLPISQESLTEGLGKLSKETVWRVKGFVKLESGHHILNWAFGRHELIRLAEVPEDVGSVKLTVMGERGEVKRGARKLAERLEAEVV